MGVAPGERAYATLFSTDQPCYALALGVFVSSWLSTKSQYPLVILHTGKLDSSLAPSPRVLYKQVPLLMDPNGTMGNLRTMATKFHIWDLVEYQQVAYYDCDHVFLSNTDHLFDECPPPNKFCSSWDSGSTTERTFPDGRHHQFNAGMMVIRPDRTVGRTLRRLRPRRRTERSAPRCFDRFPTPLRRRRWHPRRWEFMHVNDARTGGEQVFVNYMFAYRSSSRWWRWALPWERDTFGIVSSSFNVLHVGPALLRNDRKVSNWTSLSKCKATTRGICLHMKVWDLAGPKGGHAAHTASNQNPKYLTLIRKLRQCFVQPVPRNAMLWDQCTRSLRP